MNLAVISLGRGLSAHYEFNHGFPLAIPGSYQQNFVAEGIPEYVGHRFQRNQCDESLAVPTARVEQNAQFGELLLST
jgi:hypothetical protein